MNPPPPPPPHGESPKGSGLPPGNYDIFIIPPHASGSGFLYLPSLRPNVNSFAAGFASALILVVLWQAITPALQQWWNGVKGSGGMGMIMVMVAVGIGAWALGRVQADGGPGPGGGGTAPPPGGASYGHSQSNGHANGYASGYANSSPPPGSGPSSGSQSGPPPKPSWQQRPPGATSANSSPPPKPEWKPEWKPEPKPSPPPPPKPEWKPEPKPQPKPDTSGWERAREETRRKEEERKKQEAEKKRKEELEARLKAARERDAREREEREQKQKAEAAKKEVEAKKAADAKKWEEAKKAAEAKRVQEAAKKAEEAKKAADAKKAAEAAKPPAPSPFKSSYAFSAMGEKTNPWPKGQPPVHSQPSTPPQARSQPPSPTKRPPAPTAKTYLGTEEDDVYSYRPYDKPKRPSHNKAPSSVFSESSYAYSQSTSRTTPPPSHRGPYSTKDPDKIVIKAVYSFNNAFLRTPTSQLVSGVGSVTDGLILRITTEGLFIDDDVRGVPQREWDVKAWTMKLVEVWCPSFQARPAAGNPSASARPASHQNPVRRLWNMDKERAASAVETDALLVDMLQQCRDSCRVRRFSSSSSAYSASSYASSAYSTSSRDSGSTRYSFVSDSAYGASSAGSSSPSSRDQRKRTDKMGAHQTGELRSAGLHVLRASIRDQEGKRYVFVITEEESWKVAVGLQRLRKGTQVRALGVSGMSANDARSTLDNLGWA